MSSDPLFLKIKETVASLQSPDELQSLVNDILEDFNAVELHLLEAKTNKDVHVIRLWVGLENEALEIGSLGPSEALDGRGFLLALTHYLRELRLFMRTRLNVLPDMLNEKHRSALKDSFNDILMVSRAFQFVNYVAIALNGEEPPEEGPGVA